jgi:hypothetical protein
MINSVQKQKATTQKFIEILDIIDNVVLLASNNACSVIEVQAINFALLSKEEQNVKVLAYSSLLNSLSFSIQVLIRSKKIDISSYLKLLEEEGKKSQNKLLRNNIDQYKIFVQELVRVNEVLDKKFYIVLSYSGLEGGIGANRDNFYISAKTKLAIEEENIHSMLHRMNLTAKTLGKDELIKLFHEIYNEDFGQINEAFQKAKYSNAGNGGS